MGASFLLMCAALLLSCSFYIRAQAAAAPSPAYSPAPACPFPSSSSCPLHPPLSSWPPNPTFFTNMSLPIVFNQSFLFFSTKLSSSSTFTVNLTYLVQEDCPPILAFTLLQSPPLSIELTFNFSITEVCAAGEDVSLLATCQSHEPQSLKPTYSFCTAPSLDSEESGHVNYVVSLTYDADSAAVHVQAVLKYGGDFEINQTFIVNTTSLQPHADDARAIRDDHIVLFVGCFTREEATFNMTTMDDASPSQIYGPFFSDSLSSHMNNSKSNHSKVVKWVVVGVSTVALLVGLAILAVSIKKQYHECLPLVRSHLAGGHGIVSPSTTPRPPFPQGHLESQSSATPMMVGALPLSPPYINNNFQNSGTTSWLENPNPR